MIDALTAITTPFGAWPHAAILRPKQHPRCAGSAIVLVVVALVLLPFALAGDRHGLGAHHQPRDPVRVPGARPQHRRRLRRACSTSATSRSTRSARTSTRCSRARTSTCTCRSGSSCRSAPRVACFFGVLLGAPTLKLRGDYLAIVTLGFGEIIRIFLNNLSQPVNITNGPQGITLIDPFRLGDFNFATTRDDPRARFHRADQVLLLLPARDGDRHRRSTCGCRTRASAARGRRSARTRSPRARWASTRAT